MAFVAAVVVGFVVFGGLSLWLLAAGLLFGSLWKKEGVVGFFHPYTNDGGGGERVLWCAMKAVQEMVPELKVAVYTGDPATPESLAGRALEKFGVQLLSPPLVVQLRRRVWVEASSYTSFTLLGQSLGSLVLAWEALSKMTPILFIDTSGYAFTYPVARLFGCNVACYTHYPTISTDMLTRVKSRTAIYNNKSIIANSFWLSAAKVIYYRIVACAYGWAGQCTQLAMVNSSWTQSHIEQLWQIPNRTVRVYPPCDTVSLQALPLVRPTSPLQIISVAQFRPEKAHGLQLEAFAKALECLAGPDQVSPRRDIQLKLVGSCRHKNDEERILALQRKCEELGIHNQVDFCINVSYKALVGMLGEALAGLHTMTDEHFGISVVEYMAAGAIPIAHKSAGPMQDIVLKEDEQATGFLAVTVDEYAWALCHVLGMSEEERLVMANAARKRASLFSEVKFNENFKLAMKSLFAKIKFQ